MEACVESEILQILLLLTSGGRRNRIPALDGDENVARVGHAGRRIRGDGSCDDGLNCPLRRSGILPIAGKTEELSELPAFRTRGPPR